MKRNPLKAAALVVAIVLFSAALFTACCFFLFTEFLGLGYPWNTISWQTVSVQNFGTFKVPGDMTVSEVDGFVYVTDRPMTENDYEIYMVEATYSNRLGMPIPPTSVASNITKGEAFIGGGILSNGTVYYDSQEYIYGGISSTKFSLRFVSLETDEERYFICWDEDIDYDMMCRIGQSFRYEGEDDFNSFLYLSLLFLVLGMGSLLLMLRLKKTGSRQTNVENR